MQCLNKCLSPSMINYCLQLAFTFILKFMRFKFTEQFVNIAKHCGQFFSRLYLRLAGKAPTVLQVFALGEGNLWIQSCASRLDNSKFYYSLHLPLPDLPSWSLLLSLHRESKDFLSLQLSCSRNRMIPKVVLSRLKRTPMQILASP